MPKALTACLALLIIVVYPAKAESGHVDSTHGQESTHYHKNILAAVVAVAHAGARKNEVAVGFEYERRFSEKFGLGLVTEYTGGDADIWITAIPFSYHTGHWKFYVAPGIEDGHHGKEKLLRLGGEYALRLDGGWEIAPQISVDHVDNENIWVFGIVLARGF
jgi:hypothetical protein